MRLAILTPVLAVILMFAGAASAMDKENTLYIDLKDGRVVIEMRRTSPPSTSPRSRSWRARASMTAWSSTA